MIKKRLKIVYYTDHIIILMGQFISDCASNRNDYCCNDSNEELFGRRYKGENHNKNDLTYNNIVQDADLYVKKPKNKRKRNRKFDL